MLHSFLFKNIKQKGHFVNEAQVLGHLTKTHAHFLAARDFQGGTFGITILTKQKAHGERRFYYHNTSAECGDPVKNDMCQVALALLVQFDPKDPKSLFWFVCTHLVTNNMGPTLLEAQQLIEEFVPKLLREHNVSIVIGGDFNSDPNSDVIQFMSQHAKDLWSECGDPNSNGWTFSSLNPRSRIDYLFLLGNNKPINNPCKVAKVLPVTASDHMPLVVSW